MSILLLLKLQRKLFGSEILFELGVVSIASNPMDLYCDNNGAIAQANEPKVHKRAKHVL
jgi:hypothetical protein